MERQPSPRRRIADGSLAILWVILAQFLMMGLDVAMSSSPFPFPSAILAMFLVFSVLLVVGYIWDELSCFYDKTLRGPADLVNRHMSIGFSVPIVLLCRLPTAAPRTIGLIIACFLVAGIIAIPAVYFSALYLQKLLASCAGLVVKRQGLWRRGPPDDEEAKVGSEQSTTATPSRDEPKAFTSEASSMASTQGEPPDDDHDDNHTPPEHPSLTSITLYRRLLGSVVQNPLALLSWFVFLTIGLPLRLAAGVDTVLATSLLFALWFTVLAAQARIARIRRLQSWPRSRTCLTVSLNAVLWTALGLIAYVYAESTYSQRPVPEVLDVLQQNTTVANLLLHRAPPIPAAASFPARAPLPAALGAGDIALGILNAGLVSWGFKLWEYRRCLASRAGVTILFVSLVAALLNVALAPPLARAVGLRGPPAYDLAFAARTATLALGGPAMSRLGGDLGLNAALVVANGIAFQMGLGLGAGAWLEGSVGRWKTAYGKVTGLGQQLMGMQQGSNEVETRRLVRCKAEADARTVAAGVTIGINAAAMGTAHLYEVRSEAAPYAALSMTVFGVATVGFTMVPQLVNWVVGSITPGGA